ncbi:MAG: YeeE/YedE thiosulfate transporter family protein [Balneolaceae bacterium]|jgi:uncharacterized membrane protein YedE/YeeE|nr:YeeE/YedE thiosulfate transporter family protein [Balneolaceae bacterium]MDR9410106.1 YeeE/YedE thiosulfate transporter family protein [Balneolaceae bacterium]
MLSNLRYLVGGLYFGFILVKSEVVSWFRIQEMFRFQDFHMFGIIGSAIIVGIISIQIIKRMNIPDIEGNPITIPPKDSSQWKRYIIGGSMFGLGWALLGACPGPIFALLGTGLTIMIIPIVTATFGTWLYGAVRHKLPH